MTDFIIQIEPWIDHEELEQLKKVVDSTFVSEHHLNDEFENLIKWVEQLKDETKEYVLRKLAKGGRY